MSVTLHMHYARVVVAIGAVFEFWVWIVVGAFGFQLCMAHRNYHSGCVEKAMGSIIARNESRTFNQILMLSLIHI